MWVLLIGVLLTLVCVWIVVPPPSPPALVATVLSIELSPYFLLLNAILLIVGLRSQGDLRTAAVLIATLNVLICLIPIVALTRAHISRDHAAQRVAHVDVEELDVPILLGEQRTAIHAYLPRAGASNPIVFAIYGGAWQRGTPRNDAALNRTLASRGYAVFALDYRHAPAYRFPAALEDVQSQVALIIKDAATYRADPQRMAMLGHSSGGQLAELSVFAPHSPFRALVSYSGAIDLVLGYEVPPRPDPINTRSILIGYLGGTPSEALVVYRDASPIYHVRPGLPPTLLIYGNRDHVVDIRAAWRLRDAMRAAGNDVTFLELPWTEHGFENVPFGLHAPLALSTVEEFLDRTLQDRTSPR